MKISDYTSSDSGANYSESVLLANELKTKLNRELWIRDFSRATNG